MKKYKVDKDKKAKSDTELSAYKDFAKVSAAYEKMSNRPKPLYKNPKVFFVLVMIAVVAWFIAEGVFEERKSKSKPEPTQIEQDTVKSE